MEAQQSLTLPSMQSEELPGSPHGHAVCSKLDNTPGVNSRVGTLIMTNPLYEPGCSCVRDFLYTAEVSSLVLFRQVQMSVNCKYIFIYTHIYIYIYCNCVYISSNEHGWDGNGLDWRGESHPKARQYSWTRAISVTLNSSRFVNMNWSSFYPERREPGTINSKC